MQEHYIKFRTLNSLALRNMRCHITCLGAQEDQSVTIGVSKSKKINVAGQSQPKHLNIQTHGQ